MQSARAVREQDDGVGIQHAAQEVARDLGYLLDHQGPGKIARHFVQCPRAHGLERRIISLPAQTRGQPAGNERHGEHDDKGHQILPVVHFKGETRLDEEDVKERHAHKRGEHRRPQAEQHSDEQHREQEQHDDVCQVEIAEQGRCQRRQRGARADGQRVLLPDGERGQAMRTTGQTRKHDLHTRKTA